MRMLAIVKQRRAAGFLSLILAASACGGSTEAGGVAAREPASNASAASTIAAGGTTNRFYDPSASSELLSVYSPEYSDFGEFASAVDLVFVGRIVSVQRDYRHDGPDAEDPSGAVIVQDGIEFEIESVLSGKVANSGKTIVVAHPVAVNVPGQEDLSNVLIKLEPITIVKEGVIGAEKGTAGPSYIVFVNRRDFNDGVAYTFAGPGSVAPIGKDGRQIQSTGFSPFADLELQGALFETDITVDFVKDWIVDGVPFQKDPPPGQLPGPDTPTG